MDKERYVIDRFEDEGWAVLEHPAGMALVVPIHWLPDAAMEGDVLSSGTSTFGQATIENLMTASGLLNHTKTGEGFTARLVANSEATPTFIPTRRNTVVYASPMKGLPCVDPM